LLPQEAPKGVTRHAYHLFIARYQSEAFGNWPRERMLQALNAEGIPAAPPWGPLYEAPGIQDGIMELKRALKLCDTDAGYLLPHCPVAARACAAESVFLLSQSALLGTRADMDDTLQAVAKVQRAAQRNPVL
jgi:dTDP-4-amino-4,6-dideoxygalactose transaminase